MSRYTPLRLLVISRYARRLSRFVPLRYLFRYEALTRNRVRGGFAGRVVCGFVRFRGAPGRVAARRATSTRVERARAAGQRAQGGPG